MVLGQARHDNSNNNNNRNNNKVVLEMICSGQSVPLVLTTKFTAIKRQ